MVLCRESLGCEILALWLMRSPRMWRRKQQQPFCGNPFMVGYGGDLFEADPVLGHRLLLRMLVGHRRLVTLAAALRRAAKAESVVLCLGDSSTSGWDGNVFSPGAAQYLSSPFFRYPTYAGLLEEMTTTTVMNAGVPGYSSHQGLLYVELLLERCRQHGIAPLAVPIYFGNNDATYGQQDHPGCSYDNTKPDRFERVSVEDYGRYLSEMCEIVCAYGSRPILIVPLVNERWPPGLRSTLFPGERDKAIASLKETRVRQMLLEAMRRWERGEWVAALELDLVLPRIKGRYLDALFKVSRDLDVPVIDVRDQIIGEEWFLDYCHPLEPANHLIANGIAREVGIELRDSRRIEDPPETMIDRAIVAAHTTVRKLRSHLNRYRHREPNVYPLY